MRLLTGSGEKSLEEISIIDYEGNLGYSLLSQDGLLFIRNDLRLRIMSNLSWSGDLFLPDTVQELLFKDRALLLMVYRKGL